MKPKLRVVKGKPQPEQDDRPMRVAPVEPRALDADQAAAYIGVSYRVLMYYLNTGQIPRLSFPPSAEDNAGDVLRKVLIDRRDLDAFIDARKVKGCD